MRVVENETLVTTAVAGDDPAESARVTVPLVRREPAFSAQAQRPASRDLFDLGLEARRAALARGRLCGALVVELDEEGSGMQWGGATRQKPPVGISPGLAMGAVRSVVTDPN